MPDPTTPNRQAPWQIPAVLAVTVFINYLDRNNLSLAIPRLAQDFNWSDREVGSKGELLLAAFFVSYAFSNMLLSPLAERFGAKRSVVVSIAAFSLVTILSASFGYSFTALIVLRLLLGLAEGVHIPMLSAITSLITGSIHCSLEKKLRQRGFPLFLEQFMITTAKVNLQLKLTNPTTGTVIATPVAQAQAQSEPLVEDLGNPLSKSVPLQGDTLFPQATTSALDQVILQVQTTLNKPGE